MTAGGITWGLDARGLHDRFWAGHGVQIVRRGVGTLVSRAPRVYLLLKPSDLGLFDLLRTSNRLANVRMVETGPEAYAERVIADDSKRLVALRRPDLPRRGDSLPRQRR